MNLYFFKENVPALMRNILTENETNIALNVVYTPVFLFIYVCQGWTEYGPKADAAQNT